MSVLTTGEPGCVAVLQTKSCTQARKHKRFSIKMHVTLLTNVYDIPHGKAEKMKLKLT